MTESHEIWLAGTPSTRLRETKVRGLLSLGWLCMVRQGIDECGSPFHDPTSFREAGCQNRGQYYVSLTQATELVTRELAYADANKKP